MAEDLTHNLQVLYHASIERMDAAWARFERNDFPLAMYLAGLSVECVLQAIAFRAGEPHDARHGLNSWLSRCPTRLQDQIKASPGDERWNLLLGAWRNHLRYLSRDGLLGYLRGLPFWIRLKGGDDAKIKMCASAVVQAAEYVHKKGLAEWSRNSKSLKL